MAVTPDTAVSDTGGPNTEQSENASTPPKKPKRFGLFHMLVSALAAGIACGLFFGDYAGSLSFIGDAYVGLLQMTVLPYIICSVIGNIGRLTVHESKRLTITGLIVMIGLWGVGLLTVWLMSMALPAVSTGSFFSTSLLEPPREVDFLNLFIPSNPFFSLSSNYAPAVVLFCIFVGFALIHTHGKESLLGFFDTINNTLSRVNTYIVHLSPIGIFSISASATGTMTLEEFGRLQAYFVIFIASTILLTLWVLPMIVASLTPFRFRDLLECQANVLITTFVIGSVFVVIPMMVDTIRALMKKYEEEMGPTEKRMVSANPEFIVPLAYPFPHLGKIVTLIFIPFAAWFYGRMLEVIDYPPMLFTGLFLSFGKVTQSIPFLLDMYQLPSDIFQLFMMSSVVAGRFNDLLGAAHLLAFTAIVTCAMSGLLAVKRLRLIRGCATTVVVTALLIGATQIGLREAYGDAFRRDEVIARMQLLQTKAPYEILAVSEPNPLPLNAQFTRTDRLDKTGEIRIGFHPDNLPFSYYNAEGELVGFDIDMAHRLANDLDIKIVFVPFTLSTVGDQLLEDHFDIAMSGIKSSLSHSDYALLTKPYLNLNLGLLVRDHERKRFTSMNELTQDDSLVVGVEKGSYFVHRIRRLLPNATIVELWSESQFFEGPPQYMDALATSAEAGSAWTLIHPQYAIINPLRKASSVPVTYLLPKGDERADDYLRLWLELREQDGTIDSLYEYWILGQGTDDRGPRWSVIRDVLHWVE